MNLWQKDVEKNDQANNPKPESHNGEEKGKNKPPHGRISLIRAEGHQLTLEPQDFCGKILPKKILPEHKNIVNRALQAMRSKTGTANCKITKKEGREVQTNLP